MKRTAMEDRGICPTCSRTLEPDPATGALRCPACLGTPWVPPPETWDLAGGPSPDPGEGPILPKEFGPYEVLEEISRGGMGVVYRVRHKHLDRVVAMKVLIAGRDASGEQIRRFLREARAAARLRHPHIVPIHDVGNFEGKVYFTMDLVEGQSLHDQLRQGRIPLERGVEILRQVAAAIQYAHEQGVIHRDIKPANILIDSDGRSMLTDFGLARTLDPDTAHLTRSGTTMGTPNYMSPEQAQGMVGEIDERSDLYSLGAVFYEILTGVPPFVSEREVDVLLKVIHEEPVAPNRRTPGIPRDLQTICMACLEKDKARRYANAAALVADLKAYHEGEPIRARPASLPYRAWKKARKHRGIVAASALGLSVSAGILVYTGHKQRKVEGDLRTKEKQSEKDKQERMAAEAGKRRAQKISDATTALYGQKFGEAIRMLETFLAEEPLALQTPRALSILGKAYMGEARVRIEAEPGSSKRSDESMRLLAGAQGAFRRLEKEYARSPEASEAGLWVVKIALWQANYGDFEMRYKKLLDERGPESPFQIQIEMLEDVPAPVLKEYQAYVQKQLSEPADIAGLRGGLELALASGLFEDAMNRAERLVQAGLHERLYAEVDRWAQEFVRDPQYRCLQERDSMFAAAMKIYRAKALLKMERDAEVVNLLTLWEKEHPSPVDAAQFRGKFPAGDPRDEFERVYRQPQEDDPRPDFPLQRRGWEARRAQALAKGLPFAEAEPVPVKRYPDRASFEKTLSDWRAARREHEAGQRARIREFDDLTDKLLHYKSLQIEAGAVRHRAHCNQEQYQEAADLADFLETWLEDLQKIQKGRVELLRGRIHLLRGIAGMESGALKDAEDILLSVVNEPGRGRYREISGQAWNLIANLKMLDALRGLPGALVAAREALENAEGSARRTQDWDLTAQAVLKRAILLFQESEDLEAAGRPSDAAQVAQVAIHRLRRLGQQIQSKLHDPLYGQAIDLMLGEVSEADYFFQVLKPPLSDPSLRNDAHFWHAAWCLYVKKDTDRGLGSLKECVHTSRGNEWPRPYAELLILKEESTADHK